MKQAIISVESFFYQNRWFFKGDSVSGKTAEAAIADGSADDVTPKKKRAPRKKKDAGAAPENKSV